jgi:hypothetical protein
VIYPPRTNSAAIRRGVEMWVFCRKSKGWFEMMYYFEYDFVAFVLLAFLWGHMDVVHP